MKLAIPILSVLLIATCAVADLQLSVDTEYPKRLELKIPVVEDSDFKIHTSFGRGDFFAATGHVGRITGSGTNRVINLTYGFDYRFGDSHGSATGATSEQPLASPYSVRIISSILAANPAFVIREVPPPVSPQTWFTNRTLLTNFTLNVSTNATEKTNAR
ncbi:MAG: hypothetical protein IT579_19695 [Verrucomicrobia subdivision 3 bacterium]|nr:hypothetical protein [Limisphaerales bacterium]